MGWPPGGVVEDCLHTFAGTNISTCFRRGLVDLREGHCWNGKHVLNWEMEVMEVEEEDGEDGEDTDIKHWTESTVSQLSHYE